MNTIPRRAACIAIGGSGLAWVLPAVAQAGWPAKPVTVVVNSAPGSSIDAVARAVTAPLSKALGQPVIVENRSGAAGNIGAEAVVRAAPDGYTVLASPASAIAVNPFIYPSLRFAPMKDLEPVAAAANVVSLLVVRAGLSAKSVAEFIAYARAHPGRLAYASPGAGSVPHLAGENFKARTGIVAAHIPYRGASAALQDVLAGQVDFAFDPGTAISHIRAGKVRLLAVATPGRSALFPDVSTLDESGLKGFDASTTHGFYVPSGTPPAVVARLNTEINRALRLHSVQEQYMQLGAQATPMTPMQFRALIGADARRSAAIVRELKLSAE